MGVINYQIPFSTLRHGKDSLFASIVVGNQPETERQNGILALSITLVRVF